MGAYSSTHRTRLAAVLVPLLLAAGWMGWQGRSQPWRSSPTQSRAHLQTGRGHEYPEWDTWFTSGEFKLAPFAASVFPSNPGMEPYLLPSWDAIHGESQRFPYRQPAWRELIFKQPATGFPVIEGVARDVKDREQGAPVTVKFHVAHEPTQTWQGNGTGLRMAAIAVAYPNGSRNPLPVTFYDPRSLEKGSMESLIPPGLFEPEWNSVMETRLSLYFRIEEDAEIYRARGINATFYDARTFAALGRESFHEVTETEQGHFLVFDAGISLFHDTPLLIVLNLPEGPPERQVINPEKKNAVYSFTGPRPVRVSFLGMLPGSHSASEISGSSSVEIKPGSVPDTSATHYWDLGDVSVADFLELEELSPDGEWSWTWLRSELWRRDTTPLRLSYHPGLQHVCFRIAGMPMLPNRREDVRDLLDAQTPWKEAPYYEEIAAAAQLTLVDESNGAYFLDLRPNGGQLSLRDWLKLLEDGSQTEVTIDSRKLELRVKDRLVPWTERLRKWVTNRMSGGDPFRSLPPSP